MLGAPVALAPWLARLHWTFDLMACLPCQAMWGLGLASLLLSLGGRRSAALAALALTVVAAVPVLVSWQAAPAPLPNAGPSLRLMNLNLLRDNDANADRAIAAIRREQPDIVFCSEVTPAWLTLLQQGLGATFPHQCLHADPGYYGIALFSRLPLVRTEVIGLGCDWAPAVRAVVRTAAGPFGLLGVHTPRPGSSARTAARDRALAAIEAAIAELPPSHAVFGDFNATPWNPAFVDMLRATGMQRASAGCLRTTWPDSLPSWLRIPIDHVLTMPDVGVADVTIGSDFGSDHLPLAVTITFGAHH